MVNEYKFCTLEDGRDVTAWKIGNRWGEYAVIINYGATIQSLCVFDKDGKLNDVVLGADDGQDPTTARSSASVMGRCGNRIANAHFSIDGKEYNLKPGRGGHHLHGAEGNYARQLFNGSANENGVTLSLLDTPVDGWECDCEVNITYSFDDNHALTIDYSIKALGDTVISPTNHAYFNLDYPNSVLDTELKLFTETYAPKSELGMPDGRIASIHGTPLDFSSPMTFAQGFESDTIGFFKSGKPGYDDFYVMPGNGFRQVAEAVCPSSGRRMRVFSDAQGLILFTPGGRGPSIGKYGKTLDGYTSFCIEMQYVPNAVNCPEYASPVFRTGETMHSRTMYAFDCI